MKYNSLYIVVGQSFLSLCPMFASLCIYHLHTYFKSHQNCNKPLFLIKERLWIFQPIFIKCLLFAKCWDITVFSINFYFFCLNISQLDINNYNILAPTLISGMPIISRVTLGNLLYLSRSQVFPCQNKDHDTINGLNCAPLQNSCVKALTPGTSECDCIWR